MHPHTFYSTLFSPTRRDEIFVIMSFAPEFNQRWQEIIEPTIREDLGLVPNRVDYNSSGESVVHDILDGIAHARLVLADITSSDMIDRRGHVWPQRNGNVMWELGVAHVMRMPDEVIVIKSDTEESIFDLTQFRAFPYDPTNIASSRRFLKSLSDDRLKSVAQAANDHVKRCAHALDYHAWMVLVTASRPNGMHPPVLRSMRDVMGNIAVIPAINRLLEMGAISTSYISVTPDTVNQLDHGPAEDIVTYKTTAFGDSVVSFVTRHMGLHIPEVQSAIQKFGPDQHVEALGEST